jgi:hypothetical protein
LRSEDETEISAGERAGDTGDQEHPSRDAAALFGGRQDPDRAGRPSRRGEYLEAGKKRLAGDTARAATSDEVKDLRREASALKEVVAELTFENRLLKKA